MTKLEYRHVCTEKISTENLVKMLLSVKDPPSKRKVSERSDCFYSKELRPGYLVM